MDRLLTITRYYAAAQIEQALLVRRLRAAELPIGALREYLAAAPERRRAILGAHLASFRERAAAVERAVGRLRGELEDRSCAVAPAAFASALAQVGFAVADPAVRAELGAVWVETKDDSLRLVATDSYRLAVRDLVPEEIARAGIRGVIEAERVIGELATAETLVLSQSAEGTVTATIDGRATAVGGPGEGFPDYERILSDMPAGHRIALARHEVERALAGLPLDAPRLRLEFEPDRLLLDGRAAVAGTWPGPELTVLVDPRFFAEAVRATVGPDVVVEAFDPLRPITLRSADTGTFSVLTMPIRP
jgi:DNA polymerase III sliding clamp (beta) subunit (PCNA family)